MGKNNNILGNKLYLYLTEFFAGMAVMAVELGASRLLAPYFSSSQIVWTIIIGTIMIAMALGNIYGGRSADKTPDPDKLYKRILVASVWIAAIPAVGKYLIVLISGILVVTIDTNFLIIAAFAACMIIFVFPLFLLGTVTPSLVKYATESLDDNGRVVGTLGAANTIGSIIGTFLPTFVTIPAVGTAITFLIFSGVLLALGVIYFVSVKRKIVSVIVCVIIFIVCSIFGNRDSFAFWEGTLAYEGESIYNYLQVKDLPDRTILSTNVLFGVQSVTMKEDGLTGMYYDYAMAAPVMTLSGKNIDRQDIDTDKTKDEKQVPIRMLVLGMGTGTYARQCNKYFGSNNLDIRGVEIDEKITDLSYEFFDADAGTEVTTYDGRAYIKADDEKYDVIMVDAYQDITIPFQMSSKEFFREVYDHLTDDGVMVVNLNMHAEPQEREQTEGSSQDDSELEQNGKNNSGINTWLCDTIASVFGDVMTIDVPRATNRELFAMKDPGTIYDSLIQGIKDIQTDATVGDAEKSDLSELMNHISQNLVSYNGGDNIFTDNKAPVELLGMREIDAIIKRELKYYKEIFREQGLSGILENV